MIVTIFTPSPYLDEVCLVRLLLDSKNGETGIIAMISTFQLQQRVAV